MEGMAPLVYSGDFIRWGGERYVRADFVIYQIRNLLIGINKSTLSNRINRAGLSMEEALLRPIASK